MEEIKKRVLGGEANPDRYQVLNSRSERVDLNEVIFPIFRHTGSGDYSFVGTGFFISTNGIFATACHVLRDALDCADQQTAYLELAHIHDGCVQRRPVVAFSQHNHADVAVGVSHPTSYDNSVLRMTLEVPLVGEHIVAYAHPDTRTRETDTLEVHMYPDFYDGEFRQHYPNGRDRGMYRFPIFETSINGHPGSSGGPAFDNQGRVFGIICGSLRGHPLTYLSRIKELLALSIEARVGSRDSGAHKIGVRTLAKMGHVVLDPHIEEK